MKKFIKKLVFNLAAKHSVLDPIYRRVCRPTGEEHARFLKKRGSLYAIGDYCSIVVTAKINDPQYVRIGNNVRMGACALIGSDGSITMIQRAYGIRLDRVGKIDIKDNCYIGYGAIVLPGVTIGPNSIVGAGAVVTRDVPPHTVVAGNPAKPICSIEDLIERRKAETAQLPWVDLIQKRVGGFDAAMEPELVRRRVEYFYGPKNADAPAAQQETPGQSAPQGPAPVVHELKPSAYASGKILSKNFVVRWMFLAIASVHHAMKWVVALFTGGEAGV